MSTRTDLLKLAAEVDSLGGRVGTERQRSIARFAKKAIQALSNAQNEWSTVASFFESGDADKDGMEIEDRQNAQQDAQTVQRYISDALDGAKNLTYSLNTD